MKKIQINFYFFIKTNRKPTHQPSKIKKILSNLKMHIQKKKLISFFSPIHFNKTNQYNQSIKLPVLKQARI